MCVCGGELVAADEPTVIPKLSLDAIVVEDCQSDRRFPDPAWTDESYWGEVFCETDYLLDQLAASKTGPRRRGRWFSKYTGCECEILDSLTIGAADLV